MVINLTPELEAALSELAQQRGIPPEVLAQNTLRDLLLRGERIVKPRDDWERRLTDAAIDCGISVPNSALSSNELYQ